MKDRTTSSKVHDKSLVEAFREGTGGAGEREDSDPLRVWLLLASPGETLVVEECSYGELDKAIDKTIEHLLHGEGYGAALVVGIQPPDWFLAVSALEG